MSGEKELVDSHVANEKQIISPEPIPKPIAEVEAHIGSDSEEVIILENIVPEPLLVVLTDSDSDTEVGANQASTEVQNLKNKVNSLEKLWEIEKLLNKQLQSALIEIMEEQDKLKVQINKMGVECIIPCETPWNKGKRKWNESDPGTSGNNQGSLKKRGKCTNCGNYHQGVCRKGKPICYRCGQEGHVSPYCPNPEGKVCFICGSLTHQVRNCPIEKTGEGSGKK